MKYSRRTFIAAFSFGNILLKKNVFNIIYLAYVCHVVMKQRTQSSLQTIKSKIITQNLNILRDPLFTHLLVQNLIIGGKWYMWKKHLQKSCQSADQGGSNLCYINTYVTWTAMCTFIINFNNFFLITATTFWHLKTNQCIVWHKFLWTRDYFIRCIVFIVRMNPL